MSIPLSLTHQGKVRDTYAIPGRSDLLLQVATNRLSTHNIVHQSDVPEKGAVLTAMTIFWTMRDWFPPHHVVVYGKKIYDHLPYGDYPNDLHLRALVVKKLDMVPIEFIFRRYLTGSLWKAYAQGNDPYNIKLPPELPHMHRFEKPIFTPTEKSMTDDPCESVATEERYSAEVLLLLEIFSHGALLTNKLGMEIIDTKLEGGYDKDCNFFVADEFLTPDSSRFTQLEDIEEEAKPTWLDKQIFRDFAETRWDGGEKIPLTFQPSVINEGARVYKNMFSVLTRHTLEAFQEEHLN